MNEGPREPRGFTITELIVTVSIIAVLAGIAFPVVRGSIRASHKAGCLSNLRQIGFALEGYLQDHQQRMPELVTGRESRGEDLPVLETALLPYVGGEQLFHCPADDEIFAKSGSSYLWNGTQSGLPRTKLSFFGEDRRLSRIPLVADKEAWHAGGDVGTNFLYADLSASNDIQFDISD